MFCSMKLLAQGIGFNGGVAIAIVLVEAMIIMYGVIGKIRNSSAILVGIILGKCVESSETIFIMCIWFEIYNP